MTILYDTGIFLYALMLRIAAAFHAKARLFVSGRKNIIAHIEQRLANEKRERIWVHCASLGEFEQGRPVMEAIRQQQPDLCIVLTFFSPSGYEVKKNYNGADYVFYLPIDTAANARKFIKIVSPVCALFVKYEFWYHYLETLHRKGIPTILFSAIFQQRHPFFKWYGGLHRKMLGFYKHIFVQDKASIDLLKTISATQVSIAGDTRFDRAAKVASETKEYPSIISFKGNKKLLIAGSTWYEDEVLMQQCFEKIKDGYKLLIAPHEVHAAHIEKLKNLFANHKTCMWDASTETLAATDICIVNAVGHLSYLYRYANAVWIGGGFTKTGIHNIIEPAVYGLPVAFGPRYSRYREALQMTELNAALSTDDADVLAQWLHNEKALQLTGHNAHQYVYAQLGATKKIMDYLLAEKCFFSTA